MFNADLEKAEEPEIQLPTSVGSQKKQGNSGKTSASASLTMHHDPDNHDGVITHLEPDILECEVKWALGSITMNKASELTEFQLSYSKS